MSPNLSPVTKRRRWMGWVPARLASDTAMDVAALLVGSSTFFFKKNGRVCGCSFGQAERWWNSWNSWSLRCSFCFIYPAETCLLTFFFFFWAGSIFVDESKGNSDTSLAEIRAITILNSRLLYVFEFKHFYAGRSSFPETMLINFEFVHAFELCKKFPL